MIDFGLWTGKSSKIVLFTLIYEDRTTSSLLRDFKYFKMTAQVTIASGDQQNQHLVESMIMTSPQTQMYRYRGEAISIVSPRIGTVLRRSTRKTRQTEMFVAIEIAIKPRGNNKGVVDLVKLEPIDSVNDGFAVYRKSTYPLVMKLSNHGEWWTKRLLTEFEYEWVTDLQTLSQKSLPESTLSRSGITDPMPFPANGLTDKVPIPAQRPEVGVGLQYLGRSWDSAHHHPKATIEGWEPPKVQRPRRWTLDPVAIPTVDTIQQPDPNLPFILELDDTEPEVTSTNSDLVPIRQPSIHEIDGFKVIKPVRTPPVLVKIDRSTRSETSTHPTDNQTTKFIE